MPRASHPVPSHSSVLRFVRFAKMSRLVVLGLCVGGAANDAQAQASAPARLMGTVVDSLHGGRALTGGAMVLMPGNRYANVDSTGQFVFDSVPAGNYRLTLLHPMLDSLDLTLPSAPVTVGTWDARVAYTVPAVRGLHRLVCGSEAPEGAGLVIGSVPRRAPASASGSGSLSVRAEWTDLVIENRAFNRVPRLVELTPDSNGIFLLCGVPSTPRVQLTALAGRDTVGQSALTLGGLGVARVALLPPSRDSVTGERPVQALRGVNVTADVTASGTAASGLMGAYEGFESRRRVGMGAFFKVDDATSVRAQSLSDILAGMRGVFFEGVGRARVPMLRGFDRSRCSPNIFVDGMYFRTGSNSRDAFSAGSIEELDAMVPPSTIAAVEVYNNPVGIPPVFDLSAHTGCGTILVWTKRPWLDQR
jgi:hypothetical protein